VHAVIHPEIPRIGNVGMLLRADGEPTLLHPGDSYEAVPEGVDVLGVPLSAPWTKVAETVEFVRAVAPGVAVPVHDATLSRIGRGMYLARVTEMSPDSTTVRDLADAGAQRI
jgi:hypothetical protein